MKQGDHELDSAPFKPKLWKIFFHETFSIWLHGHDKLELFKQHLNKQSNFIKFTLEIEVDGSLSFLNVLVSRNQDGSISHQVYHKKTHTKEDLHVESHSHPNKKKKVFLIP